MATTYSESIQKILVCADQIKAYEKRPCVTFLRDNLGFSSAVVNRALLVLDEGLTPEEAYDKVKHRTWKTEGTVSPLDAPMYRPEGINLLTKSWRVSA